MTLFKSLRSKSSSRKSNASVTSANDSKTDFGPRSTSTTTYTSEKSAKNGSLPKSTSKTAVSKVVPPVPSSPGSLPQYTSSSSLRGEKGSSGIKDAKMMTSRSEGAALSSKGDSFESAAAKPRPSDLFAGKGVQWGAVKLAGPNITPTVVSQSNTTEDLQHFLKMRRQWKPTFATEDDSTRLGEEFQPPKDLSQLSFASGAKVQSQGLMSLQDLDESHQRKEKLLSAAPLGGSLWEEAETSKAANTRTSNVADLPRAPSNFGKPVAQRNSSYASNKSAKSTRSVRRLFIREKTSSNKAGLPRSSSNQVVTAGADVEENSISKAVSGVGASGTDTKAANAPAAALGSAPPPPVNTSKQLDNSAIVTSKAEAVSADPMVTTNGTLSEPSPVVDDADKTLTSNDVEKLPVQEQMSTETTIPKELETPLPVNPDAPITSTTSTSADATGAVESNNS